MTNMFKKSLVAIALTSVGASAMAAELTSNTVNVAAEWASTVQVGPANNPLGGATVSAEPISLELGAAYTQNDTVTLTFTGNALVVGTLPSSVQFNGPDGSATLGLISSAVNDSGNVEAVYRVTQVVDDTTGATGSFGGLEFMPRRVDSGVSVSFAAATSTGQALDTSGTSRSANLIRVGQQFGSLATIGGNAGLLNQTINVATGRLQFVNFDGTTSSAAGNFQVAPSTYTVGENTVAFAPSAGFGVSAEGIEYTLSGDFSWLLDEDGELDSDYDYLAVNCSTFEVSSDEVVAECGGTENFNPIFTVEAGNDRVIPVQSFGLEAVVSFDADGQAGTDSLSRAAGAWGLNGSNVEVSYMPYSSNITQVINVTNRSNQTGDISVIAIDEAGRRFNLGVVAQSEAGTIKPIAGHILSALSEATGVDLRANSTTRRYAFEITTNAPQGNVEVYSAYNVGQTGARLVVNSSNGGAISK